MFASIFLKEVVDISQKISYKAKMQCQNLGSFFPEAEAKEEKETKE